MVQDLKKIINVRNNLQEDILRMYNSRNEIIWEKPSSEEHDLEYYKGQYLCIEPLWDEISGNDVEIHLFFNYKNRPQSDLIPSYKINNENWINCELLRYNALFSYCNIHINRGDNKVYLKHTVEYNNNNNKTRIKYINIVNNTKTEILKCNVSGNPLSIVYGDNFNNYNIYNNIHFDFNSLFYNEKIVSAKNLYLSFDKLYGYCYESMFEKCTELIEPPKLNSTNLETACYNSMFWGCTKLEKAPLLPATKLVEDCYCRMFWGCTNLKYIECYAEENIANNYSNFIWVGSTSPNGIFVKKAGVSYPSGENGIPQGWKIQEI